MDRQRAAGETMDVHVGSADVDRIAVPVGTHEVDVFGETRDARAGRVHRYAETVVLRCGPAGPEANFQPATGEHVERCQLLGQNDRMMEVAGEHAATDSQRGGDCRCHRDRRQRGNVDRAVAHLGGDVAGPEIVVGREQRGVPESLGSTYGGKPVVGRGCLECLQPEAKWTGCHGATHLPVSTDLRARIVAAPDRCLR